MGRKLWRVTALKEGVVLAETEQEAQTYGLEISRDGSWYFEAKADDSCPVDWDGHSLVYHGGTHDITFVEATKIAKEECP